MDFDLLLGEIAFAVAAIVSVVLGLGMNLTIIAFFVLYPACLLALMGVQAMLMAGLEIFVDDALTPDVRAFGRQ